MTNCLEKYCEKACDVAERVYSSAKEIVSYAVNVGDELAASVLGTNRLEYALAGNSYLGSSEGRSGLDELLSPNVYMRAKSQKEIRKLKTQKNRGKKVVSRKTTRNEVIIKKANGTTRVKKNRCGSRK